MRRTLQSGSIDTGMNKTKHKLESVRINERQKRKKERLKERQIEIKEKKKERRHQTFIPPRQLREEF